VELFVAEEKSVEEDCANASINWPGRSNCRRVRWQWRAHLLTWEPGRDGRLGVLDAAEIRQPLARQQICSRGSLPGAPALRQALKARRTMRARVHWRWMSAGSSGDLVIGISASGRAAFVIGALRRAQEIGNANNFHDLQCPYSGKRVACRDISRRHGCLSRKLGPCDKSLTGPEIVTGSTR